MMESLRSCVVVRMSRYGSTVEKGCLVFSIINIIIVSTCLAASICLVIWSLAGIFGIAAGILVLFSIGLALFALLSFVFAVLLCMGVIKKQPSLIKAYYVYGIIERILVTIMAAIVLASNYDFDLNEEGRWAIAAIILNIIYSLPLIVVYRTYQRLSTETTDVYKLMNNCLWPNLFFERDIIFETRQGKGIL